MRRTASKEQVLLLAVASAAILSAHDFNFNPKITAAVDSRRLYSRTKRHPLVKTSRSPHGPQRKTDF